MKISVHKKDFLPHLRSAVEFEIREGTVVLIKGENGIGKSTLVKIIAREYPSTTGIVCQEEMDIFYERSLRQIKKIFERSAGTSLQKDLFEKYWKKFGLDEKEDRLQSRLSGGESQMLKICLGAFLKKDLIILDEPSQNLDSNKQKILDELIHELKAGNRKVLIIEHETSWLSLQADVINLIVKDQNLVGEKA